MPSKIRPDDWDKLFAPGAPRRGGPLRTLVNVILAVTFVALLVGGAAFVLNYSNQQRATAQALATAAMATAAPQQTATAEAASLATATRYAIRTATAIARLTPQVAGEPAIGIGVVTRSGNLRSEPLVADTTVIGLIWAGDEVTLLEQRDVDGQTWFRVRLDRPAQNRSGEGVAAGSSGWASALLLSQPTPVATP